MKHFFLSLSFCLGLFLAFFGYLNAEKEEEIQTLINHENKILQTSYAAVTNMFSVSIENYFRHVIMKPSVLELLQKAKEAPSEEKAVLRGLLYRELYTLYNGELKELGIRQLHFHTHKGESFLRFHKPNENGDALIDMRPSIKIANVDKKFVSGFEGGRVYPGFRYVFPIIDKEVHLGSVELSLSYESIEFELSKLLTCKNHILLMRKEITTSIVFENHKEHFMPANFTKNYVIENQKLSMLTAKSIESPLVNRVNTLLEALPDIEKKLASGKSFSIPFVDNDQGYIANFNAIYDISNTLAAYAVTYGILDELVIIEKKYVTFYVLGFIALLLLGIALFLLLEQRKKALREKLQFQTIVEQTINGVLLIDKQGKITFINKAACRMLEYIPEEIIGLNSHEMIHVHEHLNTHQTCPILEVIHSRQNYIGEEIFRKKSGEKITVHLNAASFIEKNKTIGVVVIFRDITQEKKDKATIEHLAYYDGLTDLPNRKLLIDRLSLALSSSYRSHQFGALLFMDLDNFKALNDTKGHHVGDLLLKEVALRLKKELRASDTVARFGGDEFVILVTYLGEDEEKAREELHKIATKLLSVLSQPYRFGTYYHSFTHTCSVSIGGTLFFDGHKTVDDMLKEADGAMYNVKAKGKNGICII